MPKPGERAMKTMASNATQRRAASKWFKRVGNCVAGRSANSRPTTVKSMANENPPNQNHGPARSNLKRPK